MKVFLLAGGLGTRLREETEYRPKPMVPIGEQPILWHIMKYFSTYGLNDFVIATGYKGNVIADYFLHYDVNKSSFTVNLGSNAPPLIHDRNPQERWSVTIAHTGAETLTGGRLLKCRRFLETETFIATYGDGLADIDIRNLISQHRASGKIATISATKPLSRFGVLEMDEKNGIVNFLEKPQMDSWINVGFMVLEPAIFDLIEGNVALEGEVIDILSKRNQINVFKHDGYWQPMDTYREYQLLNQEWEDGVAPWKIWE